MKFNAGYECSYFMGLTNFTRYECFRNIAPFHHRESTRFLPCLADWGAFFRHEPNRANALRQDASFPKCLLLHLSHTEPSWVPRAWRLILQRNDCVPMGNS